MRLLRFVQLLMLLLAIVPSTGCMYKFGSRFAAGIMDDVNGKGTSGGLPEATDGLVERDLAEQIGHQLSTGVMTGLGDGVTPELRQSLEDTVDGVITVAIKQAGAGLRNEVAPQLREMVKQDIVNALVEGFRGEVGDSLEEMAARVINAVVVSLRLHIEDPALRESISDLLRESIFLAMREGGIAPAIGDTIEMTLSENMLNPVEDTMTGIADQVASRVDESNDRIEQMMQGIISALIVISGVFMLMYSLTRRQLTRAQESNVQTEQAYRAMGAAIQLLDDGTRDELMGAAEGLAGMKIDLPTKPTGVRVEQPRSDDYARNDQYFNEADKPPGPDET